MSNKWLDKLKKEVFSILKNDIGSHDYYHAVRVCNLSVLIGKKEGADADVLKASALLHDVYADKNYSNHISAAVKLGKRILKKIGFPKEKINQTIHCVKKHETYEWGKAKKKISKEAQILQDADRIDAIGAIGIARCFAFGGKYGRPIWNPKDKPVIYRRFSKTKKSSITHFYEKLLRLKNNMNTKTGKKLAEERHKFMLVFLKKILKELNV